MRNRIIEFLNRLGCEAISVSEGSEWVRASCPLAPWLHEKGRDLRPSFGVKVDERNPVYHCFACGSKGSLPQLIHTLTWLSGQCPTAAMDFLLENFSIEEGIHDEQPLRTRRYVRDVRDVPICSHDLAVPDDILSKYPLLIESSRTDLKALKVIRWLEQERGISERAIEAFRLRYYEDILGDLGVVFPTISRSGAVVDLRVRMITEKRYFRLSPEITGSSVKYRADMSFFGEHLITPNALTWIVEGELDALRLYTLGEPAVIAVQGTFSHRKIFALPSSAVILAFDADAAGRAKLVDAKTILQKYVKHIFGVNWGWVGIKDPGELKDQVQLEEVKERMVLLYPTARDILASRKYLTRHNVLDKIRRKIAQKRAMNLSEKGEIR